LFRPILNLSQSWTRAFFPDFVRLKAMGVRALEQRFYEILQRVASMAGLLSSLATCVGALIAFDTDGFYASLYFIPLCVVRSHFALTQVRDFALERHRALFYTSLTLGGFLVALSVFQASD